MAVKGLLEQLLVEVVTDEADRPAEDEETVERADLEVLGRLLLSERAGAVEQVAEGGGDGAVDVD